MKDKTFQTKIFISILLQSIWPKPFLPKSRGVSGLSKKHLTKIILTDLSLKFD